jgi:hypothetical protein
VDLPVPWERCESRLGAACFWVWILQTNPRRCLSRSCQHNLVNGCKWALHIKESCFFLETFCAYCKYCTVRRMVRSFGTEPSKNILQPAGSRGRRPPVRLEHGPTEGRCRWASCGLRPFVPCGCWQMFSLRFDSRSSTSPSLTDFTVKFA